MSNTQDLFRPNLFEICFTHVPGLMDPDVMSLMTFLACETNVPGVCWPLDVSSWRIAYILDEKMEIYRVFFNWIKNHHDETGLASIRFYNVAGDLTNELLLTDIKANELSGIDLDWSVAENDEAAKFYVDFTVRSEFKKKEINDTEEHSHPPAGSDGSPC